MRYLKLYMRKMAILVTYEIRCRHHKTIIFYLFNHVALSPSKWVFKWRSTLFFSKIMTKIRTKFGIHRISKSLMTNLSSNLQNSSASLSSYIIFDINRLFMDNIIRHIGSTNRSFDSWPQIYDHLPRKPMYARFGADWLTFENFLLRITHSGRVRFCLYLTINICKI